MAYKKRDNANGIVGSSYYNYAVGRTGVEMPNCFTYACFRISEIVGYNQCLDGASRVRGAGDLWETHDGAFRQSNTAVTGALAIFKGGYENYGHVAVVEIVGNQMQISQSSYQEYFYGNMVMNKNVGTTYPTNANLRLVGFLIHKDLDKINRATSSFTGWKNEGGYRYYKNGKYLTNWQQVEGHWYFFKNDGHITTGWYQNENGYHYFNSKGWMLTGWQEVDKHWYYFNETTGQKLGVITKGWYQNKEGYHYFNDKGWMLTGWQQVEKHWYYFNEKKGNKLGVITKGWYKNENGYHFFNDKGWMMIGWFETTDTSDKKKHKYYSCEKDGQKLGVITTNATIKIDGETYKFDKNGWLK